MEKIAYQRKLAKKAFEEFCVRENIQKTPLWTRVLQGMAFILVVGMAFVALFNDGKMPFEDLFPSGDYLGISLLGISAVVFILESLFTPKVNFGRVAQFAGFHYEEKSGIPAMVTVVQQMGFFPSLETVKHFWMEQNGVILDMYRVTWSETHDKKTVYFSGYIFSCHMPKTVPSRTVLVSDSLLAKWRGKLAGLKRIKLEWRSFEEAFDLFSDDEIEVREIFTPDVMAVLYDFCHSMRNSSMCFMFHQNRFSCFYEEGKLPGEPKNQIREVFDNLYVMRIWPELLEHKLTAPSWLEKKYTEKRTGADLPANIADAAGLTPAMHSILEGNETQFLRYVNEFGFDMHQVFIKNGNTLLHLAAANNRLTMAQKLLEKDPSLASVQNTSGQTALDIARERHFTEMITLLEFV